MARSLLLSTIGNMSALHSLTAPLCFHEQDQSCALWRRTLAECLGTLLLAFAVTGSALVAQQSRLDPVGGLTANTLATVGALVGLIIALGPVSGGHFNPLISVSQWITGGRTALCTLAYCVGQIVGAILGAALANWARPATWPHLAIVGDIPWNLLPSEFLCSAALMLVVFGCIRSGNRTTGPFAVGAWLTAAIIASPSRSLANPALATAIVLVSGLGNGSIAGALMLAFSECAGAALALILVSFLYPRLPGDAPAPVPRLMDATR